MNMLKLSVRDKILGVGRFLVSVCSLTDDPGKQSVWRAKEMGHMDRNASAISF